jgi:hypothetical protein
MADAPPRTKAGKSAKVAKTMGEFKAGDLKSSSGDKVTNPKQAVAIALNESGQSRSNGAKPKSTRKSSGGGNTTARLASRIDRGVDRLQQKNQRR